MLGVADCPWRSMFGVADCPWWSMFGVADCPWWSMLGVADCPWWSLNQFGHPSSDNSVRPCGACHGPLHQCPKMPRHDAQHTFTASLRIGVGLGSVEYGAHGVHAGRDNAKPISSSSKLGFQNQSSSSSKLGFRVGNPPRPSLGAVTHFPLHAAAECGVVGCGSEVWYWLGP